MIPLIVSEPELTLLEQWTREEADAVVRDAGVDVEYLVGTMIETPRAALVADAHRRRRRVLLVRHQRPHADDVRVLARRHRGPLHERVPRVQAAAGEPVRDARRRGCRPARAHGLRAGPRDAPDLKLGICGEHGGDPASVEFCHEVGLDYVSCSPYRVPIARLAAAHAALGTGGPGASA